MVERAQDPNDLERYFVERANRADVDGLLALYEPDAVLIDDGGRIARGHEELRAFFTDFVANGLELEQSRQAEPVISGDIALTSSHLGSGAITAEVARRQPDGSWLWVIDCFSISGRQDPQPRIAQQDAAT